ncbi:uncharacterized protein LOC109537555 isoform X1 [Dendroctonus ponderosae]|uniref:uncharacterized protein LOC109537555 isoform X1 n=1 Tax=Dendroctonus ponderosae TaxID=77166 RepID=UPI0020357D01|nr:uncharacterized protein LOC109537555 isoform X1 [Dendroctonus ponderosae]XP_048518518.1 uncharacterized protein LOC109537555 isoform X1 [Dendroctonus ponderosae]
MSSLELQRQFQVKCENMADIETYGKFSHRRADKGSKVQRILGLFEISRPNKGLQRTNSLPNGQRPSLSSSDPHIEGLSSRSSLRRNGRKAQKNKEEAGANQPAKCKRSQHHPQILEEPDECKKPDDEQFTLSQLLRLHSLVEITPDDVFHDSGNFCDSDSDRLSMDTVFHGIGTGKELQNGDGGSESAYWDFMRSRSHEERLQSPGDSDEKNDSPTDEEPEVTTPPPEETDTPELEIEWWKYKSFVQINNENWENPETSTHPPGSPLQGRFRKNNQSGRSRRRAGILKKPIGVKELAQHFESFKDAAANGETENYRRSVICEIDAELEKMKLDGYGEDFHWMLEDGEAKTPGPLVQLEPELEDLFGEIYFADDMEKGFYYMEAWNADGKELIQCSVQIERKSIDLLSFDQMKTNQDPNILSNDDKMVLVLGSQASDDSKRNTMYSTTSGESYDDEDAISWTSVYVPSAARRETFCDQQGIVRIERVDNQVDSPGYIGSQATNPEEEEENEEEEAAEQSNYYESIRLEHQILFSVPVEVKKNTLQYIVDEIISTERKYVADMEKVLVEYKNFLEERCPEKVDAVFGNMEQIYSNQTNFLHALESPQVDIKAVAHTFLEFEDLFRLYPRYFRNTPKANAAVKELSFLIKEKQERINDKLDLSAYLLTPIQRLGKYKLFLENIIKQLQKDDRPIGLVQLSLDMVKKYMSKGNDAVALASILFSPLHTKDYGSFIAREKFTVLKPKKAEMMVFLFEGVVVFTVEDPKNLEQFVYQKSIRTHDLRIATFDNDNTIQLTDFTKTKRRNSSKHTYILDTKSPKVKEAWKLQIEDILWKQMKKIKENTLKAYQKSDETPVPVRKNPRKREQRAKSTGNQRPAFLGGFPILLYK